MRKSIELKDVTKDGDVEAVVATLEVRDKDGDTTKAGFFGEQPTKIVSSHNWDDILLGKGIVTDRDEKVARFTGSLNLADPKAEQLHSKLLYDMNPDNGPPMIEWSYGFKILDGGSTRKGQDRILHPLEDGSPGAKVYEVSPVLVGAGEGTGTVSVKSGKTVSILEALAHEGDSDAAELLKVFAALDAQSDGQRFVEQAEKVAVAITGLLDRAGEISELRKDGRLGAESMDRLVIVRDRLKTAEGRLSELLVSDSEDDDLARREYVRYIRNTTTI